MDFGLLGTVTVRREGVVLPVPGAMPRAVLAALLLQPNEVVSVARLVDVLWGEHPPTTALSSLPNHVSRLRGLLGAGDRARIQTAHPGYLIRVDEGELDLASFITLTARAYKARRSGDWVTAARDMGAALALWRGDPLADVDSDLIKKIEVPRLTELHLAALEARIEADVRLGHGDTVVAELSALIDAHPLRERLHGLQMQACHQAGRRADALAAYHRARRELRDELGVEPGAELQELHQRILTADRSEDKPVQLTTGQDAVPSQLPADVPDFAGRDQQIEILLGALTGSAWPGVARVAIITGPGGIGKTALAVHVAHRLRDRFPDGQLYASLRGPAGPVKPRVVLTRLLRDLGTEATRIPADLDGQAALLRSTLSRRAVLLVFDDAVNLGQLVPLLPGSGHCGVLVTSRRRLTGMPGSHLSLEGMDHEAALALLATIAGQDRVAAEPVAAATLVRFTAGLPLAIRIVAARIATCPQWPLATFAVRLTGPQRLDTLAIGDLAVRRSFLSSYTDLRAQRDGAAAARAFRLLSLPDGADISIPAAAAIFAADEDLTQRLLDLLLFSCLVEPGAAGRYRLHDLLRLFATERATAEETASERDAAMYRLISWYASTADAALGQLAPQIMRTPPDNAGVSVRPVIFGDYEEAFQWCERERANAVAAVHQAARCGLHALAWQLAFSLRRFFRLGMYWRDWIDVLTIALASTRTLGNRHAEAWVLTSLGEPHTHLGEHAEAIRLRSLAARIMLEIGDRHGVAATLANLGVNFGEIGRHDAAIARLERALAIFRELGDSYNTARALGNIGDALRRARRLDESIRRLREALALHAAAGEQGYSKISALNQLGLAYLELGDGGAAAESLRESAAGSEMLHDTAGQAIALNGLGQALYLLGREREAQQAWHRAALLAPAPGSDTTPSRGSHPGRHRG